MIVDGLFGPQPEPPQAGRQPTRPNGYAAQPGSGPADLTCGKCRHCVRKPGVAGRYLKCQLNRGRWTGGTASDIRARSPACIRFEPDDR